VHIEIERKYLLRELPRLPSANAVLEIDQGYIPGQNLVERLRREQWLDGAVRYYRTVKFGNGVERVELEDETDERTFNHLWQLTEGRRLRKRRHVVTSGGDRWEVDEFLDRPLVLAELEIPRVDTAIMIPEWLKPVLVREVTDERAFSNRSLAR
jgi:CYTH domain-containing protein